MSNIIKLENHRSEQENSLINQRLLAKNQISQEMREEIEMGIEIHRMFIRIACDDIREMKRILRGETNDKATISHWRNAFSQQQKKIRNSFNFQQLSS